MQSLWDKEGSFTTFQTLNRDISTEAVVIGGGLCGILTAYLYAEAGMQAISDYEALLDGPARKNRHP